MVLQQKTLLQIADLVPRSREELMQADGFGKGKWEKYGEEILQVIDDFLARPIS